MINVKVNTPIEINVHGSSVSVETQKPDKIEVESIKKKISLQALPVINANVKMVQGNTVMGLAGKSPYISDDTGTWWVFDDATKEWKDTNVSVYVGKVRLKDIIVQSDDVLFLDCGSSVEMG